MEPAHATRTRRRAILVAATAILALALALDAGSSVAAGGGRGLARTTAPARPPTPTPAQARAADVCDGTASLTVSTTRPLQLRAVRFGAATSTVPAAAVAFYDFSYGDGSDDAGSQPTAVHAYQESGTYLAKVSIVTTCNTIVSSAEVRIVVVDGLPPAVAITYPQPNRTVHFGSLGLQLTGTAQDPSGVRRVELAIQLVSLKRSVVLPRAGAAAAKQPGCYWFDGHVHLKVRPCAAPLFFAARLRGHRWSFRMNPRSQIPPGVYTARARATDRVGNITTIFSPHLGNILAFGLIA